MPGAIAFNLHEGSRSEYLAQYVFGSWGTAVSVPHQEDYGLDLFCTLLERVGQRAWAHSPYTVQVKSEMAPWVFDGADSVRWLIRHPLPLFLCVVDKKVNHLRVYHTSPRFLVWSVGDLPERLVLIPTTDSAGRCVEWQGNYEFSLSAPILDLPVGRLADESFLVVIKNAIEAWINVESHNLDLVRAGLMRFRMPHTYEPNSPHFPAFAEQGRATPKDEEMKRGIDHLREALDCLGSQFYYRHDMMGAVAAAILFRHISKRFPPFPGERNSDSAFAVLLHDLLRRFPEQSHYLWAGIDHLSQVLESAIAASEDNTGHLQSP